MEIQRKRTPVWRYVLLCAVTIVVALAIVLNFGFIRGFMTGLSYRPSEEMAEIRESLGLTSKGTRIFNASLPALMERLEFNQNCREAENETAILGCYKEEKIYIYDIIDEELKGIRELTAAHELLHAVYERMNDGEREKWMELLMAVYEANKSTLGREIEIYTDAERAEELYVRAGTEVKNLPFELEQHYAEIFQDQDRVVEYYNSYITVFREIEEKAEKLLTQIETMSLEIDRQTADYESGVETLNLEVADFNECARTLNCFSSDEVFDNRRNELLNRQQGLKVAYEEINTLILKYNELVGEYNENLSHGQTLNMVINSSAKAEEL